MDKVVSVGVTAVLECHSSINPRPQLSWRKDGGPLTPTGCHFFTADNQLIIIVKVEALDGGQYECEMTNQLGSTLKTSLLTVFGGDAAAYTTAATGTIIIATAGPQWSCTQPWAPSSWRAAPIASATAGDTEAWRRKGSLII